MRTILNVQNEFPPSTRSTRVLFTGLTLAIAASLGIVGRAAKPNPPPSVTSSIADTQNGVSLRVESDMQNETAFGGTYFNDVDGAQSIINNGELWLQTYYTSKNKLLSPRTVFLDLTEGATTPFATPGRVPALIQTRCDIVSGVSFLAIPSGQTAVCGFFIRFLGSDNQWYRLAMNTVNWPTSSNDVNITCTGAWDSTGCKSWRIAPIPGTTTGTDPNGKALAQLLRTDSGGVVLDVLGTYYVSFTFNVTR